MYIRGYAGVIDFDSNVHFRASTLNLAVNMPGWEKHPFGPGVADIC